MLRKIKRAKQADRKAYDQADEEIVEMDTTVGTTGDLTLNLKRKRIQGDDSVEAKAMYT